MVNGGCVNTIQLSQNETVIQLIEDVGRKQDKSRVFLGSDFVCGDLMLTDLNIIFVSKKLSLYDKESATSYFPINQLQVNGNMARMDASRIYVNNDAYKLTIYFNNSSEDFLFSFYDKKKLQHFIERINKMALNYHSSSGRLLAVDSRLRENDREAQWSTARCS